MNNDYKNSVENWYAPLKREEAVLLSGQCSRFVFLKCGNRGPSPEGSSHDKSAKPAVVFFLSQKRHHIDKETWFVV